MTTAAIKSRIANARAIQTSTCEMMKNGEIPAFEGAELWAKAQKEIRWLISLL